MPRVLIIEDNPVNLELVAATLELEGHQIVTAETAEVDLRLAAAEQPDLILMDLHLPGIDECEAARALQADPATTAIPVVASGGPTELDRNRGAVSDTLLGSRYAASR